MNRLSGADYHINNVANNAFKVSGLDYDLNGNIKSLSRNTTGSAEMDNLGYTYIGNQLQSVADTAPVASKDGGFKDGNDHVATGNEDYDYDENGNMTQDLNKGITDIEYNHLNLPSKVYKGDEYIKYIYDAAGIKLAQEVYDGVNPEPTKRTDYIGEFIYEKEGGGESKLQIIQHEEGRIVLASSLDTTPSEYQYHLKDHLGNTRLTFTTEPKTHKFKLNYESDPNNADDESLFRNVNIGAVGDYNSTTGNANYDKAQVLYSSPNSQTGSILAIPVGKGDKITATVNAKYVDATANTDVGVGTIAASLITAFTSGATGAIEAGTSTIQGGFTNGGSIIGTAGFGYDVNSPKAFLNMMFLPEGESIDLVKDATFSYKQIADGSTETLIDGISQNAFDVLTIEDFEATQNGYILVYVSNEGSLTDVYFDDMSVIVNESKVIQTSDYYPFGLQHAGGYNRATGKENKFLYNGKELQTDLDLGWYNYGLRQYDPTIGRWHVVDPLADKFYQFSPYNYVYNNPIMFVDPDGAAGTPPKWIAGLVSWIRDLVAPVQNREDNQSRQQSRQSFNRFKETVTDLRDAQREVTGYLPGGGVFNALIDKHTNSKSDGNIAADITLEAGISLVLPIGASAGKKVVKNLIEGAAETNISKKIVSKVVGGVDEALEKFNNIIGDATTTTTTNKAGKEITTATMEDGTNVTLRNFSSTEKGANAVIELNNKTLQRTDGAKPVEIKFFNEVKTN
jgi:RHS repeat-associated protein